MLLRSLLLTGSLLASLGAGALPVAAQAPPQQTPPQQAPTPSQAEVSAETIDQFVAAFKQVQAIRESAQAEMAAAVEAEGLTIEEFNAMVEAQQDPDSQASMDLSQQDIERFMAAADQVSTIQQEAQGEIEAAIQEEGLAVEEFSQIMALAQQDPELREAINQRLNE
ncbi:hypothetical protein XM38_024160 [Halomicronema hongdechloris C2206]|uniref:DUF4168 domain-containing protein n=1 Tax=Halomicronema hongdechloris C2206 TaxID=1641165 RepID=A0A1Z3HMD6_9CYAN|nr:DUF4168 domain-containing protein [Halomicronema hongdechloris]ASC71464.1 hypothetical protein XM38_024160 [Halomicronema hongdechloris C2206]